MNAYTPRRARAHHGTAHDGSLYKYAGPLSGGSAGRYVETHLQVRLTGGAEAREVLALRQRNQERVVRGHARTERGSRRLPKRADGLRSNAQAAGKVEPPMAFIRSSRRTDDTASKRAASGASYMEGPTGCNQHCVVLVSCRCRARSGSSFLRSEARSSPSVRRMRALTG